MIVLLKQVDELIGMVLDKLPNWARAVTVAHTKATGIDNSRDNATVRLSLCSLHFALLFVLTWRLIFLTLFYPCACEQVVRDSIHFCVEHAFFRFLWCNLMAERSLATCALVLRMPPEAKLSYQPALTKKWWRLVLKWLAKGLRLLVS